VSTVMQNVNLYLPEFRKKKYWLDAEKMVLVAGASALLLVVVSAVEFWQLMELRAELAGKEQDLQATTTATAALLEQYGVQTEDPALLESIQELEADLQSKQALLQFLEGRELGNADGFSEHLADLSRYHVQGLSLTEISLTDGGRTVELSGQVVRAGLVMTYLTGLSKGGTYAGTDFDRLQIDDEPVTVASEAGPAAGNLAVWNFNVRSFNQ
jgi:hypothetical protein